MPTKAAKLKKTRAQRIPFRPGVRYSNRGRIHSHRPFRHLHLSLAKRRRTIHSVLPVIRPQCGVWRLVTRRLTLEERDSWPSDWTSNSRAVDAGGHPPRIMRITPVVALKFGESLHQGFIVDMGPKSPFDTPDIIGGQTNPSRSPPKLPVAIDILSAHASQGRFTGWRERLCGNRGSQVICSYQPLASSSQLPVPSLQWGFGSVRGRLGLFFCEVLLDACSATE
jgi:hypothetical protein